MNRPLINGATELDAVAPLPLRHCWPLIEAGRRFELGMVLNSAVIDMLAPHRVGELGLHHSGLFECDLFNDRLAWSGGVFDLFGLPRGTAVSRQEAVALYDEGSRAAMERLRAHAIRHERGFTLDVEIRPATAGPRWMRLIAAPVCQDGRAVRLHGLKLAI